MQHSFHQQCRQCARRLATVASQKTQMLFIAYDETSTEVSSEDILCPWFVQCRSPGLTRRAPGIFEKKHRKSFDENRGSVVIHVGSFTTWRDSSLWKGIEPVFLRDPYWVDYLVSIFNIFRFNEKKFLLMDLLRVITDLNHHKSIVSPSLDMMTMDDLNVTEYAHII